MPANVTSNWELRLELGQCEERLATARAAQRRPFRLRPTSPTQLSAQFSRSLATTGSPSSQSANHRMPSRRAQPLLWGCGCQRSVAQARPPLGFRLQCPWGTAIASRPGTTAPGVASRSSCFPSARARCALCSHKIPQRRQEGSQPPLTAGCRPGTGHDLAPTRDVGLSLADMAPNHLQLRFGPKHRSCPLLVRRGAEGASRVLGCCNPHLQHEL